MNEEQFKAAYITNFLATYMAKHYVEDCMNGHSANRHKNQPIEDAEYCAREAWKQLQNHTQELRSIPDNLFVFSDKQ